MRLFLSSLALSMLGCGGYGWTATVVAPAPPAPYVEVVGNAPGDGYVWVDGYWWWDGGDYVWVRGHWGVPPQVGYVYAPAGWVYEGGNYVYVHGRWAAPTYTRSRAYVHPRPAVHVRSGARYQTRPARVQVRGGGRTTVRTGGAARVRAR